MKKKSKKLIRKMYQPEELLYEYMKENKSDLGYKAYNKQKDIKKNKTASKMLPDLNNENLSSLSRDDLLKEIYSQYNKFFATFINKVNGKMHIGLNLTFFTDDNSEKLIEFIKLAYEYRALKIQKEEGKPLTFPIQARLEACESEKKELIRYVKTKHRKCNRLLDLEIEKLSANDKLHI